MCLVKIVTSWPRLSNTFIFDLIKVSDNEENLGITKFEITDGNVTMQINFDGFIPDLFQDNMGVILDGYFDDGIFYSDDMLVKHDNEYISEDGEVYNVENYKK